MWKRIRGSPQAKDEKVKTFGNQTTTAPRDNEGQHGACSSGGDVRNSMHRLKAEADAGSRVVEILVEQSASLKLERDAAHTVSHSILVAALKLRSELRDEIVSLLARELSWRCIAQAALAGPPERTPVSIQ